MTYCDSISLTVTQEKANLTEEKTGMGGDSWVQGEECGVALGVRN